MTFISNKVCVLLDAESSPHLPSNWPGKQTLQLFVTVPLDPNFILIYFGTDFVFVLVLFYIHFCIVFVSRDKMLPACSLFISRDKMLPTCSLLVSRNKTLPTLAR